MMNIDITYLPYGLLAANGLLVAAASLAIMRLQRFTAKQKAFWESPTGAAVRAEQDNGALAGAIAAELAKRLGDQSDREEAAADTPTRHLPMDNAVRMAQHGAGVDELVRACGLSTSEARLLIRVHGRPPQVARAS